MFRENTMEAFQRQEGSSLVAPEICCLLRLFLRLSEIHAIRSLLSYSSTFFVCVVVLFLAASRPSLNVIPPQARSMAASRLSVSWNGPYELGLRH